MILKLRDWIGEIPTARTFNFYLGDWYSYHDSSDKKYIAVQQNGGRRRDEGVRYPHYVATAVSAKVNSVAERDAAVLELLALMDTIIERTRHAPCSMVSMVSIAPLGEVVGPVRTDGGRMVVTLTLECISE